MARTPIAGNGYQAGSASGSSGIGGAYGGLAGILSLLQGGISQHQFDRLGQGYDGLNGGVGGGAGKGFAGLSPYALNFLMNEPGLMGAIAPKHLDDTVGAGAVAAGADGTGAVAGLTADQAFMNHLMNGLYAAAPKRYQLHSGVDQAGIMQLLQQYRTNSGHSIFNKGYNAAGMAGTQPVGASFVPPHGG